MTHIDRELEHYEAILYQTLSEEGSILPLLLSICRKIKKDQYPHNPIFAEPIHYIEGYITLRELPEKHFCKEFTV